VTEFVGNGHGHDDRQPGPKYHAHLTGMGVVPHAPVSTRFICSLQPIRRATASLRSRLFALMMIAPFFCCPVHAQQQPQQADPQQNEPQQGEQVEPPSSTYAPSQVPPERRADPPNQDTDSQGFDKSRIFGVLPNYSTVERNTNVPQVTTKTTFQMFALGSFDPYVFPFVAFTAGLAQVEHEERSWGQGIGAYGKRYLTAFSDNTIGNLMTTAVAPTLLHTDPRYFVLGEGGFLRRAGYALSRSVVTRTRGGRATFNLSEIGGNAVAAGISNAYHPPEDRTVSSTMSRWGMQVMWDTLTNELKEFWPDIRRKI
jgi:hypothetical protein